ncbi:sigma-70 family RNA polymerase sigma factor [Methylobacterium sp. P5_C11]
MGTNRAQPAAERTAERWPILPEAIGQHLGRLLASTYEGACTGPSANERFADLLERLGATLDKANRCDTAEFQARLLGVAPALRQFALSLSRDPTAADDLVQETLMRAWRSRGRFEIGTNFEAWTFTILRNHFYTSQRKSRELPDGDGAQAARLAVAPEQGGHLDLLDLQAALAQLAAPTREALVLVTIEALSYEQAAAIMGCELGTVKSRVSRARDQLARMLGYKGFEIGGDGVLLSAMAGPG